MSARSLLVTVAAAAVCLSPAVASAQTRTITAVGNGTADVRPGDRNSNASIKAAIERAEQGVSAASS